MRKDDVSKDPLSPPPHHAATYPPPVKDLSVFDLHISVDEPNPVMNLQQWSIR